MLIFLFIIMVLGGFIDFQTKTTMTVFVVSQAIFQSSMLVLVYAAVKKYSARDKKLSLFVSAVLLSIYVSRILMHGFPIGQLINITIYFGAFCTLVCACDPSMKKLINENFRECLSGGGCSLAGCLSMMLIFLISLALGVFYLFILHIGTLFSLLSEAAHTTNVNKVPNSSDSIPKDLETKRWL